MLEVHLMAIRFPHRRRQRSTLLASERVMRARPGRSISIFFSFSLSFFFLPEGEGIVVVEVAVGWSMPR